MKLKRLIIQGFKSFKDRTTITFDEGITGIVGPNGCGKSNIVDALFWVMGEQSAKHLRGSNMQDLIFAGSSKYQPASWAEVTLVLENDTGKHISVQNTVSKPAEIQLTRKLYRNGDTEYRINNEPARLRDIHEVFMDTGAGAKSYSIIAQGEINKLVQAKPEERRTMIEEVAGITKFKMRKKESLKKIEQTELNLGRLNDLKNEVYKTLKSLEKQAEKADRAKTLKEKITKHDLIVNAHKEFDLLQDYKENRDHLLSKKLSVSDWTNKRTILENDLEEERFKKTEMMERVEGMQDEFNHASKELVAGEERLKFLKRSLEDKQTQIDLREKENNEIQENIENRKSRIGELEQEKLTIEESQSESLNFLALEEKLEVLKEELSFKDAANVELNQKLIKEKAELANLEQIVFKNNSKLEEYAKNLEDLNLEIEAIEKQYSVITQEMVKERDEVKLLEGEVGILISETQALKSETITLNQQFQTLDSHLREKSKDLINTESKLSSLKDIALLDSQNGGAKEFLESSVGNEFAILGNLLESDKFYAKAIQNLFGEFFNSVVSPSKDFSSLLAWVNEHKDLGFKFLDVEASPAQYEDETIERLKLNGCEEVIKVRDLLKINNPLFEDQLSSLFNGFYLVSNLSLDILKSLPSGMDFKGIASFDGKVVGLKKTNAKTLQVFADFENSQGVVERNNLIQELVLRQSGLSKQVTILENDLNEIKSTLDEKNNLLEEKRTILLVKQTSYSTNKAGIDLKLNNYESSNSRLSILKNRKNDISRSRLEMIENEENFGNKYNELQKLVSDLTEALSADSETLQLARQTYQNEKDELTAKIIEAKSFESRLKNIDSQIEDVNTQLERSLSKLQANQALLEQYSLDSETTETAISTLALDNSEKASTLADEDTVLNQLKDELADQLFSMKEREDEVRELTVKINKTEKELVETEIKIGSIETDEEQITRNTFEKYRVDVRHVLSGFLSFEETDLEGLRDLSAMYFMETEEGPKEIARIAYSFERRYGQHLRDSHEKLKNYRGEMSRLGEINWQAIEDYDRQKLRYNFLEEQENELKNSLVDLQAAISHIDEKSKARFKEAYDAVNERFEKVFPIIFGGGSAKLDITGDLDSPECGIDIIAQPPGKKMQNINLMSGGEKAMTAVSLIFSIFLVKPSPFCLLDEVDAPLDDANVGRFNELLREMSSESQFILITHNKKTMELNDTLYGVTMQEPGISKAVSVQLH